MDVRTGRILEIHVLEVNLSDDLVRFEAAVILRIDGGNTINCIPELCSSAACRGNSYESEVSRKTKDAVKESPPYLARQEPSSLLRTE